MVFLHSYVSLPMLVYHPRMVQGQGLWVSGFQHPVERFLHTLSHQALPGQQWPGPRRACQLIPAGLEHCQTKMTDGIVDTMSNRFPNKMPECQMDGISEYMSDIMPDRMSDGMSECMSARMPDRMSEYVYTYHKENHIERQIKCQHMCQIECQIESQISCQILCQTDC